MLITFLFLSILLFLALTAFFSGSETAIISANKVRLRTLAENGDRRADRVIKLLNKPEYFLGVTLVGTNIFIVASTTLAAVIIASLLERISGTKHTGWEDAITTLVMTSIILIFGEIIPKSVCRMRANSISLFISTPIKFASIVFYPLVTPVNKITRSIALLFGRRDFRNDYTAMEELKLITKQSEKDGLLRPQQRKMIHGVIDLREQTIGRIMVPLVDVVSVEKNISLEGFYDKVARTRFSRFPVYAERVDNIIGIVSVLDILYSADQPANIKPFIHEDVVYLPESKHITSSLRELQNSQHPMGIVVDEYGGVVGIVTLEDIVTEIVGEMKDEQERKRDRFDGSTLECDGRTEIDEINERLGTDIPKDEYETIAGFVISQMDKIPNASEEFLWKNLRIIVRQADKRSVLRVKIIIEKGRKYEETETGNT